MKRTQSDFMQLHPEDLIPVVCRLTKKYTSNESTSISFEVARQLMEAALYCIHEYFYGTDNAILSCTSSAASSASLCETSAISAVGDTSINCDQAYTLGYQQVIRKANCCKEIYHQIIADFEDYDCCNYRDTITVGMPSFFLYYDAIFAPQNTILTLDYPVLSYSDAMTQTTGVDLIYEYLRRIQLEQSFLTCFQSNAIRDLLLRIQLDYKHLYLDNICRVVLLVSLCMILIKKPVNSLCINESDCEKLYFLMSSDSVIQIEYRLLTSCTKLCNGIMKHYDCSISDESTHGKDSYHYLTYFKNALPDFAFMIHNGIEHHSLEQVLFIQQ